MGASSTTDTSLKTPSDLSLRQARSAACSAYVWAVSFVAVRLTTRDHTSPSVVALKTGAVYMRSSHGRVRWTPSTWMRASRTAVPLLACSWLAVCQ